jgi:receptor protein-tyrosine kinase
MKIVAALRRGRNEISELLPHMLEQPSPERPPAVEDHTHYQVQSIADGPNFPKPLASCPIPPSATPAQQSIRQAPIRLSATTPLLPFDDTNLIAAEQYRMIRTRLVQHPAKPRMVLVSSAGPGDGKSVTAVNIAGALSLKSEGKVVLMDADFRRSTIHAQMGLPLSPGMTEVLSGAASLEDALIRTTQFPNLYVITAGTPAPNPSELLASTAWRSACEMLRNRFQHVIVDSPPVASVADYDLLQAACDGVVLVLRPDHTCRSTCLKILETMPKEKLLGVILNCVPQWFLNRRDQYGSYYSYYGGHTGKSKPNARPADEK